MTNRSGLALTAAFTLTLACDPAAEAPPGQAAEPVALADALLFHAGFDGDADAAYARGDGRLYTAPSYTELEPVNEGIDGEAVAIAGGAGRYGDALQFQVKNEKAVFYNAADNVAYSPEGWSGTISFWLSLDPATDLEPGFSDPIQITDTAYNDNAIWVDFTDRNPRAFRMGVFGELDVWNGENPNPTRNPVFGERLVPVMTPPFGEGRWTHVAIVHEGLGGGAGRATLYLDGVLRGSSPAIAERFQWDVSAAKIRLGVNYVGLFDDLAIFDRALSEDEIVTLRSLEGGVTDLGQ